MQKNHLFPGDTEDHARDAMVADVTADFVQPLAERAADRHSDGPAEFGGGDVLTDRTTAVLVQALQPFPHWLAACSRTVERRWQLFDLDHGQSVSARERTL